jgi:putative ABC transport system permease protein
MLYGVTPLDVPTYGAVALLFIIVAVGACWVPAHRATRIDPLEALRFE